MSSTRSLAIIVIVLFAVLLSLREWPSYAQERFARESDRTFDEEDLASDPQTVAPGEEYGDERVDEESPNATRTDEEEFSERDSPSGAAPPPSEDIPSSDYDTAAGENSREESPEEPLVATSGPPALPDASSLVPRDQVALSFVTLGVEAMEADAVRARALLERAMEIAPLLPYSYFFLGRLSLIREEHQKALPLLRKAEILLTRGDQAWRSEAVSAQGAVYEDLGELPQARRAYRRSLRFFPQNLRAMSALARLAEEGAGADDAVAH